MKKILVALLATASVAAFADSDVNPFYVTAAVGVAQSASFNTGAGNGQQMQFNNDSQYTLGANIGYNFNKNFAIEAGYTNFMQGANEQFEQLGVTDLAVRGTLPLNDTFSLFGRLGLAGYDTYTNYDSNGHAYAAYNDGISVDNIGALYGVGGEFNLNKSWALTAELWGVTGVSATNVQLGGKFSF